MFNKFVYRLITGIVTCLYLVMGTAALLPHGHEEDFTHAEHSDCPLYQVASQAQDISPPSTSFDFAGHFIAIYKVPVLNWVGMEPVLNLQSRAPPAV